MNNNTYLQRRIKKMISDGLIYLFIALVSLTCVLPFFHVLAKSVSEENYVVTQQVVLWPKGFTLDAYQKIFADKSILRSFNVSVFVTVVFTLLGMVLTVCAAYPLSRKDFKGRAFFPFSSCSPCTSAGYHT